MLRILKKCNSLDRSIFHPVIIFTILSSSCNSPSNKLVTEISANLEKHTVISDGHPIALWSKNPEEPKGAILFIHGRTWGALPLYDLQVIGEDLSLMDGMVKHGYATYAIDLRGYGDTPRDSTQWNTGSKAAKDILTVLKWIAEKHNENVHLFGWSMGAPLSLLAAQGSSDHIASLILFGFADDLDSKFPTDLDISLEKRPTTAEAALEDFVVPGSISQNALDAFVKACLENDPVRADWNELHEFNELDPGKIDLPVLLIQAEFDQYAKTEWQIKLFTRLKTQDKMWAVLPGGDHIAPLENTRVLFIKIVVDFLDKQEFLD